MGPNLAKGLLRFGLILVISFIVGSSFPRHNTTREALGFPVIYRYDTRPQFITPLNKETASYFNAGLLIFNIWILFMGSIVIWYVIGAIYLKLSRHISAQS